MGHASELGHRGTCVVMSLKRDPNRRDVDRFNRFDASRALGERENTELGVITDSGRKCLGEESHEL